MLSAAWESYGLWGLLASSFLSATILPGNSEVVLVWMLRQAQWPQWQLLAAAVVGNTLGSLCSVWMGRGLAILKPQRGLDTATRWIERYGVWSLWFSWLPLIGDILCLLAGWFRLPWASSILFILLGKTLRYLVIILIFNGASGILFG